MSCIKLILICVDVLKVFFKICVNEVLIFIRLNMVVIIKMYIEKDL